MIDLSRYVILMFIVLSSTLLFCCGEYENSSVKPDSGIKDAFIDDDDDDNNDVVDDDDDDDNNDVIDDDDDDDSVDDDDDNNDDNDDDDDDNITDDGGIDDDDDDEDIGDDDIDPDQGYLEYVSGCPKEPPEYVESSPECPEGSRYVPEGWSTLGRVQLPPDRIEPEDWYSWLYPPVNVYVSSFCMHINEVTNLEYKNCVEAGVCDIPQKIISRWRGGYYEWKIYQDFPVLYITYSQAEEYCEWIGGRLPTESEWEKAARGPEGNWYPWGDFYPDDPDERCEYGNIGEYSTLCNSDTCSVGLYPKGKSGYGMNDMMGNVAEIVIDAERPEYLRNEIEGTVDPYITQANINYHGIKGGSFNIDGTSHYDVEDTYAWFEDDYSFGVGFRCITWSAATLTPISFDPLKCRNEPPEQFPEPTGFTVENLESSCAKWGQEIRFHWDYFWDYHDDCGGYQFSWREANSLEWNSEFVLGGVGKFLEIHGVGNGDNGKGVKYYFRLRPYWGKDHDEKICSDTYAELTLTLAEDLEAIECPPLEPATIGYITNPDPANQTYECF